MEYEDNHTRSIHSNAIGPDQQGLREEIVDDEFEMEQLLQDVDSVHRTLLALYPDMEIDPNMVFEQLEVVKHNADRVFHVVSLLSQLHRTFLNNKEQRGVVQAENDEPDLEKDAEPEVRDAEIVTISDSEQTTNINDVEEHSVIIVNDNAQDWKDVYGGLVQDVNLIMDVFPDADPQEVYAYLEARREESQRVTNVIEELIHRRPVVKGTTTVNAPFTKENYSLLSDEERKRVGDVTEPNVHIPNKKLRVEQKMEIEPSLHVVNSSPSVPVDHHGVVDMETSSSTSHLVEASSSSAIVNDNPSNSGQEEDLSASQQLLSQLQVLKDTFPDADQNYLSELVNSCGTDETKLQATVSDMLENRAYPKLKDQLERERKQALKKEYSSRIFTPEEVLQWFEDPIAFFSDNSTPVSKSYEMHTYAQLNNEFPKLVLCDIKRALIDNNQHYTGAFHALKEKLQEECKTLKFKRRKARPTMILPEEPDELFYKELSFTRIEEKLKDYLKTKEMQRTKRMEEAKSSDELITCSCCYDDENLPEEMIDCGLGHLFCRECVRRGAEVAIGDGKNGLECMSEKCGTKFELQALQLVLKSNTFSNLLARIQAEEISNAEIPDLVQCPHCSFAAIMPNQDDKVFRCLNPKCLKETCRVCKEPNHVPLRCEEVEKSDEVKMRTYIENKMTDALVRKCYRCSRRFMKEEGCNKMTCVCGATMCYVCRQPIKDYQHFQKGGCPQMSDTVKLHHEEVRQGAEKAKKEFVDQHPELKDTKLKHDPMKDLLNGEHPTPFVTAKANIANNFIFPRIFNGIPPGYVFNIPDRYERIVLNRDLSVRIESLDRLQNELRPFRGQSAAVRIPGIMTTANPGQSAAIRIANQMRKRQITFDVGHGRPMTVERIPGIAATSDVMPENLQTPQPNVNVAAAYVASNWRDENEQTSSTRAGDRLVFLPEIYDLDEYQILHHLQVPKQLEIEMPVRPIIQPAKLFAGRPGGTSGTPATAHVTRSKPSSMCAISSTSSHCNGLFNAQMRTALPISPNLESVTVSRNVIKRGATVLSIADSSSSVDNGSATSVMPSVCGNTPYPTLHAASNISNNDPTRASCSQSSYIGPRASLGVHGVNSKASNITMHLQPATSSLDLCTSTEFFRPNISGTNTTNSTPIFAMSSDNYSLPSFDYHAAGSSTRSGHSGTPTSTLNTTANNSNNNLPRASGLHNSSDDLMASLGMQLGNGNTYNDTAHLHPDTVASDPSTSAEFFHPNTSGATLTNRTPVFTTPTGNGPITVFDYQAAGPSTSNRHEIIQNENRTWQKRAPVSGNCNSFNQHTNK